MLGDTQVMEGTSLITVQEESAQGLSRCELVLKWVWPRYRLDRLKGARLAIGRDENATIQLDGAAVSRHHAELYRQGPLYVLRDLGSTNGTWLGGTSIEHAPIAPRDVLRVGDWVGVFVELGSEDGELRELAPGVFGGPEVARLFEPLRRAAGSKVPVLLVGETGTGKERLARAVHHFSGRSGPFLALNCASMPEQLAEGELFGYRRGAFTGAERAHPGHFRAAHGGTLFLDEMPDLSPALQAKLLRIVEDGEVLALGESSSIPVDVRIVSASQRPLKELVAAKRLREDLAARLTGLELLLPTLTERRSDVAPLFARFLEQQTGGRRPDVEARLVEALCLHDWPQNVRELELLTRTLLAVHGHEPRLLRQHLPPAIAALCRERRSTGGVSAPPRARNDYDLARLEGELTRNGGNIKAAAQSLGISRQRIYRLLDAKNTVSSPAKGGIEGSRNDLGS
ncbi:MAG TPA: sigma 54-interacting transcriptional regulator [Polyangiaceae bacterium]|nr:sigma 54-interacting transcriptional regulator [Polyangiaceae bacterium]